MESGYIIGQRIATLRKSKKLSQQQLAGEIGESREMIKVWENGTRHIKEDAIIKLADYFGVTTDYLLCVSESKSPVDTDVTILTDRFGFSPKAAREITVLSIPDNGEWAIRRFAALNRLIEYSAYFEGLLSCLELCMRFGQTKTLFESVIDKGMFPDDDSLTSIVSNKEQFKRSDRGMMRSAAIYNPQYIIGKIAETMIEESENAEKHKNTSGDGVESIKDKQEV